MTDQNIRDLSIPPDLNPALALLLAMLQDATSEWREELAEMAVPEDAIVRQIYPNGHSIGVLILHMIEAEIYWIEEVAAGRKVPDEEYAPYMSKDIDQYNFSWPVPPRRPLQWYFDQQDKVRARSIETIRALADPMRLAVRRDKQMTLRSILSHVIVHEAYHGGQAVLLAVQYDQQRNR